MMVHNTQPGMLHTSLFSVPLMVPLCCSDNGLHVKLQRNHAPNAFSEHCAAHRLNLTNKDLDDKAVFRSAGGGARLFNFYRYPVREGLLNEAADELGLTLAAITRRVKTRWLSYYKVFDTAWQDLGIAVLASDKAQTVLKDSDSRDLASVLHDSVLLFSRVQSSVS